MKIALYKNVKHDYETVHGDGLEGCVDYVRLSEWVEVEFPRLRADETVLEALDKNEQELREQFQRSLERINRQRQDLQS